MKKRKIYHKTIEEVEEIILKYSKGKIKGEICQGLIWKKQFQNK